MIYNRAVYDLKRSEIREFSRLAKETEGCIALTLGEPEFTTSDTIFEKVKEAYGSSQTHYIANTGKQELKEAISQFEKKHQLNYDPDEIIVTNGATEALFVSLFSILNPNDEVIIPQPAFSLYEEIVSMCRAKAVYLDTSEDDYQIRKEKLKPLINGHTKAIILNSPNNPTGTVLNKKSLNAVYQCIKNTMIFAVCDDVYRELTYTRGYHSFMEYQDIRSQLILIQSFSKPWAMTGWRMGYIASDRISIEKMELVHQFTVVSTPSLFQDACVQALKEDPAPLKKAYDERIKYILKRLEAFNVPVIKPQGAFYLFPSIEEFGMTSREFCLRLIREGKLALTPGSAFGDDSHVRMSCCYKMEEIEEAMDRFEAFITKLRNEKEK